MRKRNLRSIQLFIIMQACSVGIGNAFAADEIQADDSDINVPYQNEDGTVVFVNPQVRTFGAYYLLLGKVNDISVHEPTAGIENAKAYCKLRGLSVVTHEEKYTKPAEVPSGMALFYDPSPSLKAFVRYPVAKLLYLRIITSITCREKK